MKNIIFIENSFRRLRNDKRMLSEVLFDFKKKNENFTQSVFFETNEEAKSTFSRK